jgi:hypothetical protein
MIILQGHSRDDSTTMAAFHRFGIPCSRKVKRVGIPICEIPAREAYALCGSNTSLTLYVLIYTSISKAQQSFEFLS